MGKVREVTLEEDRQDGCARCLRGMSQKARRLARVPKGGWEIN